MQDETDEPGEKSCFVSLESPIWTRISLQCDLVSEAGGTKSPKDCLNFPAMRVRPCYVGGKRAANTCKAKLKQLLNPKP